MRLGIAVSLVVIILTDSSVRKAKCEHISRLGHGSSNTNVGFQRVKSEEYSVMLLGRSIPIFKFILMIAATDNLLWEAVLTSLILDRLR